MVTMFCPPMTIGPGETVVQAADGPNAVVDCNVIPVPPDGHVKMTVLPESIIPGVGALGTAPVMLKLRLTTVPADVSTVLPVAVSV
jgi:hypothetical protein